MNIDREEYVKDPVFKLLQTIGTPSWFKAVGMRKDPGSEKFIKLTVNSLIPENLVKDIPVEVDGVPVRIFYKSPFRR
jgi:hypothetical protein